MRGALIRITIKVDKVGIIPAYAGSTDRSQDNRQPTRDHPRVCGEHP